MVSKTFDDSFSTEKTSPTINAINRVSPTRHASIGPQPKAAAVLNMTMGFMTGAAKRNATPADKGNPLWNRRRVKGITPHSQTGKTNPMNAPVIAAGMDRVEITRAIKSRSRNTSTSPEMKVPIKR